MILRLDKNKVLHITQNDYYAGENTQEMLIVYIHPFFINTEPSKCEFVIHFKNSAIPNGILPLFLSNEKKDSFYIAESIIDSKMLSLSGLIDVWLEIQTPTNKIESKSVKFNVKPSRKQKANTIISEESTDLENRLIALENRCKIYYQMAHKEAEKSKKCVQMMIDILKESGGIR